MIRICLFPIAQEVPPCLIQDFLTIPLGKIGAEGIDIVQDLVSRDLHESSVFRSFFLDPRVMATWCGAEHGTLIGRKRSATRRTACDTALGLSIPSP